MEDAHAVTPMASIPTQAYMERAIDLATRNVLSGAGGPFAALIVRDGIVLAEAANTVATTNDPTAHAEVNAIRKACAVLGTFSLQDCDIYTSCEPCPMCLGAIYWSRIVRIFYGNGRRDAARAGFRDSLLYEECKLEPGLRSIPAKQVMAVRAWESFQAWLDLEKKTEY